MHHKFAVGLDADRAPRWVLTGSYNPTDHARGSLENVLLARAPALACIYYREYQRLFRISRHVVCRPQRPLKKRGRSRVPDESDSPRVAGRA